MTRPGRAVILAAGDAPSRTALDDAWPGWDDGIDLVIAADGGARHADPLGLELDRWVGDGDSLGPEALAELRRRGVEIDLWPVAKDASDTELALLAAVAAGAHLIVIVGALGGLRPDHALANVALLGHPAAAGRELLLVDPSARIRLLSGPDVTVLLEGRIGDLVSLIPLERSTGVSTEGLRFPLHGETLEFGPARGISNIRDASPARVSVGDGRLLIVEAPARLSR